MHKDEEALVSRGHIVGIVKDVNNGQPIIDAKIIAVSLAPWDKLVGNSDANDDLALAELRTKFMGGAVGYTDATGNFDLNVNLTKYKLVVHANGYRQYTVNDVDLTTFLSLGKTVYLETVYLTPIETYDSENVFISGRITNAITGEPLEDVKIKFRQGTNNYSGEYVQIVSGLDIEIRTDNEGYYYTAALQPGNYTLEAEKDGYILGYATVISGNSDFCSNQNLSLTPEISSGTIRIVLEWGATPPDLDSHVVGTISSGDSFHVYYRDKSKYDGNIEVCNLDYDDTESYGPETITLTPTTMNPYYYYIHNYSGTKSLTSSGAKISVYQESRLLGTFNVPINQGEELYWNVFSFVDGEIVVNNTLSSAPDLSYAQ